jgi:hypothetical protein
MSMIKPSKPKGRRNPSVSGAKRVGAGPATNQALTGLLAAARKVHAGQRRARPSARPTKDELHGTGE